MSTPYQPKLAPVNDPYLMFVRSAPGKFIAGKAGLPQPPVLRRFKLGEPALTGPVLVGGKSKLVDAIKTQLKDDYNFIENNGNAKTADKISGLVFDATTISNTGELVELFNFFNPHMRSLAPSARVIVIGATPELITDNAHKRTCQRALEGFTRSVAKELMRGATAQLVYIDPTTTDYSAVESTLRFLLSGKSAFVDGQVIRVGKGKANKVDWKKPLDGKVAVVTGAARGIGATIAEVFARDGAKVIVADIPAAGDALSATANRINGAVLPLDVTDPKACEKIAELAKAKYGSGVDILVNNAGITKDKLLANMDAAKWNAVIAVNLTAPQNLVDGLFESGVLNDGGAIIDVSSIAGIAGNRGQTNYATTKAGVIGLVDSHKDVLAKRNITINAVAPGFIETAMTAAIPFGTREGGRLLSSLLQGGHTVDVAETIAFFASNASNQVSGNVVRVCGQAMMGA